MRRVGDKYLFLPGPVRVVTVFETTFGEKFFGHL
jgi:hypothetical protein